VMHMFGNSRARRIGAYALIAFLALLLGGCVTEQKVCESNLVSGHFEAFWNDWRGMLMTGVLIIFIVSGFVYMLGNLLTHRGLLVWAKNQMYEGFVTLIFAFFALSLVGFICSLDACLVSDCTASSPHNAFDLAQHQLEAFSNKIAEGFWWVAGLNFVLAALVSMNLKLSVSGVGPTFSFANGLSSTSQQLGNAMMVIVAAQVLTMAQILILRISEKMFFFLLPAGILLRSFGMTRGFGGALVAIAIGFYLIYPLSIVLFYGMLDNTVSSGVNSMASQDIPSDASASGWDVMGQVCTFIGTLIVGAALIPFMVFIVVVSFVKGLSSAIGEEVDVSNLTRLV